MGSSVFPNAESSKVEIPREVFLRLSTPGSAEFLSTFPFSDSSFALGCRFSAASVSRIWISISLNITMMSSMASGEVTLVGKTSLTSS